MGQPIYSEQLLRDYDMWELPESFWSETPMSTTWEHTDDSVPLDPETSSEFISLIARLLYLAMQTRPDILFAVNTLAQFQRGPRMCDMDAGVKILSTLERLTISDSSIAPMQTLAQLSSIQKHLNG